MAWDQGPYPVLDGIVQQISPNDAPRMIREQKIDCVYSLFQEYDPRLFAPATSVIEHDISALLRVLLLERQRGAFDAPIIRHWGFDVHQLDPGVACALDAHIFCNREKFVYFTEPISQGGCGLDVFRACKVIAFMDSDRPKAEFMNDDFAPRLSDTDGDLHTVCIGRPFGIDYLAAARHGIHVHIYSNNYDDPLDAIARKISVIGTRDEASRLSGFVHVHPSLQTIGASWPEVQRTKSRWVREFSQYDAGWSYIGDPLKWKPLDNCAAIPNRLSTYVLAGIRIITDRRPGFYRHDEPHRLGVAIDLDGDYGTLRESLELERRSRGGAASARRERNGYSFDATIDLLLGVFDRARAEYFAQRHAVRTRFLTSDRREIISFHQHAAPTGFARWRAYVAWVRGVLAVFAPRFAPKKRFLAPRLHGVAKSWVELGTQGTRSIKVAVLERFADPSRRCDPEAIGGPMDEVTVWNLTGHLNNRRGFVRNLPAWLSRWRAEPLSVGDRVRVLRCVPRHGRSPFRGPCPGRGTTQPRAGWRDREHRVFLGEGLRPGPAIGEGDRHPLPRAAEPADLVLRGVRFRAFGRCPLCVLATPPGTAQADDRRSRHPLPLLLLREPRGASGPEALRSHY